MKVKFRRKFKYTFDNIKFHEILTGEYEVGRQVDEAAAQLALAFGAAVIVPDPKPDPKPEKAPKSKGKAPENKAVKAKETK